MSKNINLIISEDDFAFLCRIIIAADGFDDVERLALLRKFLAQEENQL